MYSIGRKLAELRVGMPGSIDISGFVGTSVPFISTTNRLGMLTRSGLFYCNGKRMISMVAAFFET